MVDFRSKPKTDIVIGHEFTNIFDPVNGLKLSLNLL